MGMVERVSKRERYLEARTGTVWKTQNVCDSVCTMIEMEPTEPLRGIACAPLGGGTASPSPGRSSGGENGRWNAGTATAGGSGRTGVGGVLAGHSSEMMMTCDASSPSYTEDASLCDLLGDGGRHFSRSTSAKLSASEGESDSGRLCGVRGVLEEGE